MATSQSLAQALSEIIDYDPYGNVITPQPTSSTSLLGNTTSTAANQVRQIPNSFEGDSSDVPSLSPQTLGFLSQETPYDNEGRMTSIDRGLQTMAGFLPVAGFVNQLPTYLSSPILGAIVNAFSGKSSNYAPVESIGSALGGGMGSLAAQGQTSSQSGEGNPGESAAPTSSDTGVGNPGESDGYAKGGRVDRSRLRGPDPQGPDQGYAPLQSGEYVIKRDAVNKYGEGMLGKINAGKYAPRG
jgi:hypothetical protein